MMSMMLFSIKVASVIGKFSAVPRQAHFIVFLENKDLVTPIVVMPSTIIVATKATSISNLNKNKKIETFVIQKFEKTEYNIKQAHKIEHKLAGFP